MYVRFSENISFKFENLQYITINNPFTTLSPSIIPPAPLPAETNHTRPVRLTHAQIKPA